MDDIHGPLYRLRGAEQVVGLEVRGDGHTWDLWVGGGTIVALRPAPPAFADDSDDESDGDGGNGGNRGRGRGRGSDDDVPTIDCSGLVVLPGLVDLHVHAAGDCGELGYADRGPEATLQDLLNAGVTTFVGVLGRDAVSRGPAALLAKVRGLAAAGGITGLCVSGAADGRWPPASATGDGLRSDLELLSEVAGSGTYAVSDPDGPTAALSPSELLRAAQDTLAAGALARKAGLVYCSLGPGDAGLDPLRDLVLRLPTVAAGAAAGNGASFAGGALSRLLPSVGSPRDAAAGADDLASWLADGGRLNLSAGGPGAGGGVAGCVNACLYLLRAVTRGSPAKARMARRGSGGGGDDGAAPLPLRGDASDASESALGRLTVSSGAFAALPRAADGPPASQDGRPLLRSARPEALLEVVRRLCLEHGVPLVDAAALATVNPAAALGPQGEGKGRVALG